MQNNWKRLAAVTDGKLWMNFKEMPVGFLLFGMSYILYGIYGMASFMDGDCESMASTDFHG
jgi:hypothetical protein